MNVVLIFLLLMFVIPLWGRAPAVIASRAARVVLSTMVAMSLLLHRLA